MSIVTFIDHSVSQISSQELSTLSNGRNDMLSGKLESLQILQTVYPQHCPFSLPAALPIYHQEAFLVPFST